MEGKNIEIPFGAFDSELGGFEYTIPEGYEAEIKDGKVIVKKKDSEDERIIERIKKAVESYWSDEPLDEILAWLEKQGEQKPADKVAPKFKVGDTVRFKGNETLKGEAETHKIVGYDNELYVFADGTTDLFCEQELYELVEQKSIAWSEEDEDMLQSILDEYKSMTTEKRNWLKLLKERVQPQFTWRPSEHELEVLKLVAEKDGTCLMGLYKQLKKLKEE